MEIDDYFSSLDTAQKPLKIIFPTRQSIVIFLLVCIMSPCVLVGMHLEKNRPFSPIDEPPHYAYVDDLSQGQLPRVGEFFSTELLRTISCVGLQNPWGETIPNCQAQNLTPSQYPSGGGRISEAVQPPLYYASLVPFRWAIGPLLTTGDLLLMRSVNLLWLCGGLAILWCCGRLLGIDAKKIGGVILLVGAAPIVIYYSSIVSNDASAIFAGSFISLIAILYLQKRLPWRHASLFAASFAVGMLKPVFLLPAIAVALVHFLVLLSRTVTQERSNLIQGFRTLFKQWLPFGGILVMGSLSSLTIWTIIEQHRELVTLRYACAWMAPGTKAPFGTLIADPLTMWNPFSGSYSALNIYAPGNSSYLLVATAATTVATTVFIASGFSGLFVRNRNLSHVVGLVSIVMLYVGGFALDVFSYINCGVNIGAEGRYGLCLVPLLVLSMSSLIDSKWVVRFIWLLAITSICFDGIVMTIA
jgi:hypothetical protein